VERSLADDLRDHRPEAIDRLLDEHGVDIQAVAQVILRDGDEAADVLADTVITAWEHPGRLRDPAVLRTRLLGLAARIALERHRSADRFAASAALLPAPECLPWAPSETQRIILEGLALLEPRDRAIVALCCLEELAVEEVAIALHTSAESVRAHLREALLRLRSSLVDEAGPGLERVETSRVARRR
jgi:RNA polymerase sigma-70 factor (ECF subfamily)